LELVQINEHIEPVHQVQIHPSSTLLIDLPNQVKITTKNQW
jgi:hypothetical protein